MKNRIIRTFTLIISILTLTLALGIVSSAEDYKWTVIDTDGNIRITKYVGTGSEITIPSTIQGHTVKQIGFQAFYKCTGIKKVTIPNTVTSIGKSAFYGCTGLSSISIPNSVTGIGELSFVNCTGLSKITIPNSVTNLGYGAFADCKKLTSINIPNKLTGIGEMTFLNCSGLTNVVIPDSVTSIGDSAFADCTGLNRISIPNSVSYIGDSAFLGCKGLSCILIPKSVTSIGNFVFEDCNGISVYFEGTQDEWNKAISSIGGGYKVTCGIHLNRPTVTKIINTVSGVHIYWTPHEGYFGRYDVYRSLSSASGYTKIGSTTVPNYTDTNVKSGTRYYYQIRTALKTESSLPSQARSVIYVATPDIKSRANTSSGIKVTWNMVTGATGYAIYRWDEKTKGSWARVATISGNSTFTWIDAASKSGNGITYHYTVRALAGEDKKTLSGCRNNGRTIVRLFTPTISSCTKSGTNGIKLAWNRNAASTGYEIRFMVGDKVYFKQYYGSNTVLNKTITGMANGSTYKVQIRYCYKTENNGTYYSAWSAAKKVAL